MKFILGLERQFLLYSDVTDAVNTCSLVLGIDGSLFVRIIDGLIGYFRCPIPFTPASPRRRRRRQRKPKTKEETKAQDKGGDESASPRRRRRRKPKTKVETKALIAVLLILTRFSSMRKWPHCLTHFPLPVPWTSKVPWVDFKYIYIYIYICCVFYCFCCKINELFWQSRQIPIQ